MRGKAAVTVLFLLAVFISAASAQVTVSIGDIEASPGESITAPIMIYDVTCLLYTSPSPRD